MFEFEYKYKNLGYKLIGGVDEVGRGPLAGPVVVAACIMPLDDIIDGIYDSKKLSEKKREFLNDKIIATAMSYNIVEVDNNVIDDINILNATKLAMKQAIEGLSIVPDIVLIDAVKIDTAVETHSIIKGDMLSYSIAAASIIAKVYRDRLMCEFAKAHPEYGFEKHKGYGTKMHYDAIAKYGLVDIHRRSFLKRVINNAY